MLEKFALLSDTKRWWLSIVFTLLVNSGLYILLIFVGRSIGLFIFGLVPLLTGFMAAWLYGYSRSLSVVTSMGVSFTALVFLICLLILLGMLTTSYMLFMIVVSFNLCLAGSFVGRWLAARN